MTVLWLAVLVVPIFAVPVYALWHLLREKPGDSG
jgi:hypothetical protein